MMNEKEREQQKVSKEILADIDLLVNVARGEIAVADKDGDPQRFNEASLKYGPIAHRVYLALDKPQRSCETYHDEGIHRVMLDPWTVLNRSRSNCIENIGIDDPEFWNHADMIKSLTDYLLQNRLQEKDYAST